MVCLKEGGVTEQIEEDFPGHTIRYQKHIKDYTAFKKLRDVLSGSRGSFLYS